MENQEVINYLLAHNDLKIIQRKDMFNFSLDTVLLSQFCTINKDVKNIVDWCNERHIGFYLEANSGMYCNDYMLEQGPETMVKYAKGKGASLENAKSSAQHFIDGFIHLQGDELYRDDVNKISFILRTYQDHLDSKVDFPHLVANTWGGKGEVALFGDLGPTGITKRHAIEVLLDYLHADPKDTISFGDAKIDLSMFECCAYNVAMGNGGSEIKEAADYITDDNDYDGIGNYIEKFILGEQKWVKLFLLMLMEHY